MGLTETTIEKQVLLDLLENARETLAVLSTRHLIDNDREFIDKIKEVSALIEDSSSEQIGGDLYVKAMFFLTSFTTMVQDLMLDIKKNDKESNEDNDRDKKERQNGGVNGDTDKG